MKNGLCKYVKTSLNPTMGEYFEEDVFLVCTTSDSTPHFGNSLFLAHTNEVVA